MLLLGVGCSADFLHCLPDFVVQFFPPTFGLTFSTISEIGHPIFSFVFPLV